jgi:hypothetical protein
MPILQPPLVLPTAPSPAPHATASNTPSRLPGLHSLPDAPPFHTHAVAQGLQCRSASSTRSAPQATTSHRSVGPPRSRTCTSVGSPHLCTVDTSPPRGHHVAGTAPPWGHHASGTAPPVTSACTQSNQAARHEVRQGFLLPF